MRAAKLSFSRSFPYFSMEKTGGYLMTITQEKPINLYAKLRHIDPDAAKESDRAYKRWWYTTEAGKAARKRNERKWKKNLKSTLVMRARARGRKAGLGATIKAADIEWPTHCPVLGIPLDYETPRGKRSARNPNLPSLDRWDNSKGYIPGNVFVISLRANALKGNATADELEAVARYARGGALLDRGDCR